MVGLIVNIVASVPSVANEVVHLATEVTTDYPLSGDPLALDSVATFEPGPGSIIVDPGTDAEEVISFEAISPGTNELIDIERTNPIPHPAGAPVQLATEPTTEPAQASAETSTDGVGETQSAEEEPPGPLPSPLDTLEPTESVPTSLITLTPTQSHRPGDNAVVKAKILDQFGMPMSGRMVSFQPFGSLDLADDCDEILTVLEDSELDPDTIENNIRDRKDECGDPNLPTLHLATGSDGVATMSYTRQVLSEDIVEIYTSGPTPGGLHGRALVDFTYDIAPDIDLTQPLPSPTPDDPPSPDDLTTPQPSALVVLTPTQARGASSNAIIKAKVLDQFGMPMSGRRVSFQPFGSSDLADECDTEPPPENLIDWARDEAVGYVRNNLDNDIRDYLDRCAGTNLPTTHVDTDSAGVATMSYTRPVDSEDVVEIYTTGPSYPGLHGRALVDFTTGIPPDIDLTEPLPSPTPDDPPSPEDVTDPRPATVVVLTPAQTYGHTDLATVSAKVLDQYGNPMAGERVSFEISGPEDMSFECITAELQDGTPINNELVGCVAGQRFSAYTGADGIAQISYARGAVTVDKVEISTDWPSVGGAATVAFVNYDEIPDVPPVPQVCGVNNEYCPLGDELPGPFCTGGHCIPPCITIECLSEPPCDITTDCIPPAPCDPLNHSEPTNCVPDLPCEPDCPELPCDTTECIPDLPCDPDYPEPPCDVSDCVPDLPCEPDCPEPPCDLDCVLDLVGEQLDPGCEDECNPLGKDLEPLTTPPGQVLVVDANVLQGVPVDNNPTHAAGACDDVGGGATGYDQKKHCDAAGRKYRFARRVAALALKQLDDGMGGFVPDVLTLHETHRGDAEDIADELDSATGFDYAVAVHAEDSRVTRTAVRDS